MCAMDDPFNYVCVPLILFFIIFNLVKLMTCMHFITTDSKQRHVFAYTHKLLLSMAVSGTARALPALSQCL